MVPRHFLPIFYFAGVYIGAQATALGFVTGSPVLVFGTIMTGTALGFIAEQYIVNRRKK